MPATALRSDRTSIGYCGKSAKPSYSSEKMLVVHGVFAGVAQQVEVELGARRRVRAGQKLAHLERGDDGALRIALNEDGVSGRDIPLDRLIENRKALEHRRVEGQALDTGKR